MSIILKHSAEKNKSASAQWFCRGFGKWVMREEKRLCREALNDALGLYAAQLGGDGTLTHTSAVRHKILINNSCATLRADWCELPLESDSLDLIVLVHALESSAQPHAVLRETVRVLRPEGRMIIIGFNPWSLLRFSRRIPWRRHWLSVGRVNDWLTLLEMQPLGGEYAVFLPPWQRALLRRWRLRWLELAGRRWWPLAGGIYVLNTIKRRHSMRLIIPSTFQKHPIKNPSLASYKSMP